MSQFETRWVEHATRQFNALAPSARQAVMARIAQLESDDDPGRLGTYNEAADTYTTDFSEGFVTYAVVAARRQVILLRVTAV